MTGKRTGWPIRKRPDGECASCHRTKSIRARQLCETCYIYARKLGTLRQFPTKSERLKNDPLTCRCYAPIEEAIGAWGVQCKKCGRKIP